MSTAGIIETRLDGRLSRKRKVASLLQHGVLDLTEHMKKKSSDLLQTYARLYSSIVIGEDHCGE